MRKVTIRKKILLGRLRQFCIQQDLYTRGTNEQYKKLFQMATGEITDQKLVDIAEDIWDHSCIDKLQEKNIEFHDLVAQLIANCVTFYATEEE